MAEEEPVRKRNRRFGKKTSGQWLLFVGDCKLLGNALAAKPYTSGWVLLQFVDALLRGYGQAVFCNNPITGLLFVIALTFANPAASLVGLVSGTVGLLVSVASQQPKALIREGLTAYNPILLGLVTASMLPTVYGLEMNARHWLYLMTGVVFCVYITSALSNLLGSIARQPLPCLAVPFVTIQMIIFLCIVTTPVYNGADLDGSSPLSQHPPHVNDTFNLEVPAGTRVKRDENTTELVRLGTAVDQEIRAGSETPGVVTELEELDEQRGEGAANMSSAVTEEIATYVSKPVLQATTEGSREALEKTVSGAVPQAETSEGGIDIPGSGSSTTESAGVGPQQQQSTLNVSQVVEDPHRVDWGQVFTGVILSLTQAFGYCNAPAAVLMYLGIVICSPTTAALFLLGSTLGSLTGLLFCPAPYAAVYEGVWGFNGMLCAGALGGFCFVITWQSAALALVCAVFATCLQNVLNLLFQAVPMPIMSVPFNISTLLFLCVSAEGDTALVRPAELSFAEKHRHDFGQKLKKERQQSSDSISVENDCGQEKRLPVEEV